MPGEDAISFHVYGADVGVLKRLRWDPRLGYGEFIQGYSNEASGLPVYLAESVPAPTRWCWGAAACATRWLCSHPASVSWRAKKP